ncbi:MAG TPA: alpha/beta fold hydrolase [Mycobacterium sp.]
MPSFTWDVCGLPRSLTDAGFQVVAYNARGMSPSSAPAAPYSVADLARDAAAILDRFQIERATVVGYSMGCYTAQMLLRIRPELVGALVLFAGLQPSTVRGWRLAHVHRGHGGIARTRPRGHRGSAAGLSLIALRLAVAEEIVAGG